MPEPEGNESISQEALDALLADMADKDANTLTEEAAAKAGEEQKDSAGEASAQAVEDPGDDTSSAPEKAIDFATFGGGASAHGSSGGEFRSFDRVQDIPLEITVELGRTKLLIRDILDLESGAIIELEKMAGEPVDLLANGLLVARGEVVVIEDNFGVRITEIITQAERKEVTDWGGDRRAA